MEGARPSVRAGRERCIGCAAGDFRWFRTSSSTCGTGFPGCRPVREHAFPGDGRGAERQCLPAVGCGPGGARMESYGNGSSGPYVRIGTYGNAIPDIAVEAPAGNSLNDGGAVNMGTLAVATIGAAQTFTIRNVGAGVLEGISLGIDGEHLGDFVLGSSGEPRCSIRASRRLLR